MLSIVIPTLNEEKYLPVLLESIKAQDFKDYELIISDAFSKDKTEKIARAYGALIVKDKKKSPARQRNNGAKIASGDTILFLDADTKLPVNFLSKTYHNFVTRNLSVAGFYLIFDSPFFVYRVFERVYHFICYLGQYFFPASVGVGIIVKKKYHQDLHGFDEDIYIGEDYDYVKRISKKGKYRMINNTKLYFSVRRLEKEGMAVVLWKWFKGGAYFICRGPIRKKIVKYDFGDY